MALHNSTDGKNPLRRARIRANLTQKRVAEVLSSGRAVAYNHSTVANWELWNAMPSRVAMAPIRKFCGSKLKPVKFYDSWQRAYKRHQKAAQ